MMDRKKRRGGQTKNHPKSERPPVTARTPTGDKGRTSTDESNERASQPGERDFDPNVNQRPPR
jgi:hypothetical protein